MLKEFKAFAVRGNVIDLAVGVIVGAAFGKIVDSAVNDLIMPLVAAFPEGTAMTLDAMKKAGVPVFAYGNFITVAVNFVILAFIIFLMIKQINKLKGATEAEAAPVEPKEEVLLLRDIRDSLKK
jgi:large conductance mechanosensitive channel